MKFYFAYGMNTNHYGMAERCPNAFYCGSGYIDNAKLVFKSVADYEHNRGYRLHGAIWYITDECEKALDTLEGYPTLYGKRKEKATITFSKTLRETEIYVMIYKMNRDGYYPPSNYYYEMLHQGYKTNRLPMAQLKKALENSKRMG
tara:strand:- start:46 stop:483 length:438 start_codon:yes stop_codon:yes gene_type:complete